MAKVSKRRTPKPLSVAVSTQMKRMSRSSTGPELIRRELHRRGLRYRINHPRLPGRPDIAFTAARIAVLIDGCFWHSCPDHGVVPKNNREWWREKLERNVQLDHEKDGQLEAMGWTSCTSGSTKDLPKRRMRLRSCGGPHVGLRRVGLTIRPGRATCEILVHIFNGTGR